MRGKLTALLAVLLVVAMLAACSNSGQPSNTGGNNGAGTGTNNGSTNTGGSDKPGGTVEYWSMFNVGEPLQVWLEEKLKQFEGETGITVKATWSGRDVITNMRSSLLSGNAPDLVDQSNAELTAGLISNELVIPLDEHLDGPAYGSDGKWRDTFVPNIMSEMEYSDGKTYIIPRDAYSSGVFYSKKLFDDLGLQPPQTWEQFIEVSEKLKANGIAPLAADGNIQFYNVWYFNWLAMREVGPEKLYAAAADETGETWREPGFLEAAKKVSQLVESGYFASGYEGSAYPAAQVNWINGNAGMMLMGAWMPKEMSEQTPEDFDMQMFPFPDSGAYDPTVTELWANGWAVLKDGKNNAGAVELLKFLTSKPIMEELVELGTPGPIVGLNMPQGLDTQADMLANASQVVPKWAGLERDFAELNKRVLWMVNDELFFGKITPEQYIEKLVKEQKAYYGNK